MQRFILGWAIAVIAALTPALALAEGPGKAQQIANALRDSGRLKDYNINVKFQGGIARLQGQVTSPQQMGQALAIARDVPGVERVINEMSINGTQPLTVNPAEQAPRALELAAGSKSLSVEEAPEPSAEFTQHTEPVANGPVIGGVVDSNADSPIDYAIPSRTVAAQNRVVRPMQPAELGASSGVVPASPGFEAGPLPMPMARQTREAIDQQTAQQVANQFRAGGKLKNYRIGVTVQDGVARLNGTVASKQQMAQAVFIAKQSRGVTNVVNELTVGQPGQAAGPVQRAGYDSNMGAMGNYNGYNGEVPMDGAVSGPMAGPVPGTPLPAYGYGMAGAAPAHYDEPSMPNHAWPSYAAYPNYGAVTYPRQYSPTAWPYIGPFYPYPQVPLGWRKVTLEWDDGWWFLDFDDKNW